MWHKYMFTSFHHFSTIISAGPKTPEWTDYYHVDFTTLENARKISRSDNYKKAARQRQHKNRHEKIGNTNEESKMNDDGEAIPKPPVSAYMDYSSSIRPKIKEENPNATPTEMVSIYSYLCFIWYVLYCFMR